MFSIGDESQTLKLATEDVNCQHAAKWQELEHSKQEYR